MNADKEKRAYKQSAVKEEEKKKDESALVNQTARSEWVQKSLEIASQSGSVRY